MVKDGLEMEIGNVVYGHHTGENRHHIDRDKFSTVLEAYMQYMGFDHYGNYDGEYADEFKEKGWINDDGDFENDVFAFTSYCWCMEEGGCHRDEKSNFYYKPMEFKIDWYKYPLRDSYSNKEFTVEEFVKILDHCVEAIFEI